MIILYVIKQAPEEHVPMAENKKLTWALIKCLFLDRLLAETALMIFHV